MKKIAAILLLGCGVASAADWATTRDTDLRPQPLSDSAAVARLAVNTPLNVVQRRGGWYEVMTDSKQRGWLRLFHVRRTDTGVGGFFQQAAAVIDGGRNVSRKAQATTGIRGVDEADLKNSKPDFKAVDRLGQYTATQDSARRFAAELNLQPQFVALPE